MARKKAQLVAVLRDALALQAKAPQDEGCSLAAGDAHVAPDRRALVAPVDDKIVPLGLAADSLINRRVK